MGRTTGTCRVCFTFSALPKGEYASRRIPFSLDHCPENNQISHHMNEYDLILIFCRPSQVPVEDSNNSIQPDSQLVWSWVGLQSNFELCVYWNYKKSTLYFIPLRQTSASLLADTNVSHFALLHHFLELLPSGIRVVWKFNIYLWIIDAFERYGPV